MADERDSADDDDPPGEVEETPPADPAPDEDDIEDPFERDQIQFSTGKQPSAKRLKHPGSRQRKRVASILEGDPPTVGNVERMLGGAADFGHRLVLRGKLLTSDGGPARLVLDLTDGLARSLQGAMPSADPYLQSVAGSNSIEVNFYPPPNEVAEATERLDALMEERDAPSLNTGAGPEVAAGTKAEDALEDPRVLPDTTLAVLALSRVLAMEDPAEAAREARRLGKGAADEVRNLAVGLVDADATLDISSVRPSVAVQPQWCLRVVEHLDATAEMKPTTVTLYGFLQGANSGGDGYFELVLDSAKTVPRELGARRKPGSIIHGKMTSRARGQIRVGALWDTEVEARVQVIRREKAGTVRVEGLIVTSVKAWRR